MYMDVAIMTKKYNAYFCDYAIIIVYVDVERGCAAILRRICRLTLTGIVRRSYVCST